MIKTILQTIAYILLLICVAAGLFLVVAGLVSGMGTPTLSSKIMWAGAGLIASVIAVALMYIVSGRNWAKLGEDLLRLIWLPLGLEKR
ncbi:hypothetical protein H7097_01445 [Aeromicrobium sp.]|nr:hypothetical protein [Candidatus Saccharibacteria bacterium]